MKNNNLRRKNFHCPAYLKFALAVIAAGGLIGIKQSTPAQAQPPAKPEFRVDGLIENGFLGDPKGWNLSNFGVDKDQWITRKGEGGAAGVASTPFLGPDGFYKIRVMYWDEGDGVSTASLAVGGRPIGTWQFDGILIDAARWKEFDGVEIKKGDEITLSGRAGGYEYCRIIGVEILPSKPLPAPPPATAVEKKEYSMNLVPISGHAGVKLGANYVVPPEAFSRGGGTHWIYLKAGQEFQLQAEPGFAGHNASLQYSLTKVGAEKPLFAETLVSDEPQPIFVRLRAGGEGVYELKVAAAPEAAQSGVRVNFDVPGVAAPGGNEGYFFVPQGVKLLSVKMNGHSILQDATGKVIFDEWLDNEATRVIEVPAGSDDQVWYFQGPLKDLSGVPPYISFSRETMLTPAEVLK